MRLQMRHTLNWQSDFKGRGVPSLAIARVCPDLKQSMQKNTETTT